MRHLRAAWNWLHRPPKDEVSGWDVQASIFHWGIGALPIVIAGAIIFGDSWASFALLCLSLAGVALGVWLRTGRHWHPIRDFRRLREDRR